jgi:uracil-DNA glycosylase family 4
MESCLGCRNSGKPLKAIGNAPAPIMVVIDAVSQYDSVKRRMYSDKNGKLVTAVINGLGLSNVYMTAAIKCPVNRPTAQDINTCRDILIQEIREVRPKVIITLGSDAYHAVTGSFINVEGMAKASIEWCEQHRCYIKPQLHPDYILYRPGLFREYVATMEYIPEILTLPPRTGWIIAPTNREIITTMSRAKELVHYLVEERYGTVQHNDFETSAFSPELGVVIAHGICVDEGQAFIFPKELCKEQYEDYWALMKFYLESRWVTHGWQNGKFDIQFGFSMGVDAKVDEDTMLAHYSIDERKGTHSLDQIAMRYIHVHDWEEPLRRWRVDYIKRHRIEAKDFSYDFFPEDMLYEYLGYDVDYACRSFNKIHPIMMNTGRVSNRYYNWLIPGSNELARMEFKGAPVNLAHQAVLEKEYSDKLDELDLIFKKEVEFAGWTPQKYLAETGAKSCKDNVFNPKSNPQMQHLLFDMLRFPLYKGKRSADKKALKWLIEKTDHPILIALQKQRKMQKLFSTYIVGIKTNAIYGMIHSPFKLHGTETARLSSGADDDAEEGETSFNLQNIPRQKDIKNLIWCPWKDYLILQADYSQAELRCLAVITDDPFLKGIYYRGEDIHDNIAAEIWGPNFTSEDRVKAKAIDFGIVYGITEYSLASDLSTPEKKYTTKEAKGWIDAWLKPMPKVAEWLAAQRQSVIDGTICETVFGHRRHWGLVTPENLKGLQNEACNTPIQSAASDLTLRSLIEYAPQVRESNLDGWPVITVHDSTFNIVHKKHLIEYAHIMKNKMETLPGQLLNTDLPFKVDLEIGRSWGDLYKFNLDTLMVTKKLKDAKGNETKIQIPYDEFIKEV